MAPRAAVWKIAPEVMESMLRMWFKNTRCQDDPTDLRLIDVGHDGRHVTALVELIEPVTRPDRQVQEFIDQIVKGA